MSIILYTNECPLCKALKSRLDEKQIKYEIFDDVEKMIEMGFRQMPQLQIDGERLNFQQALQWIKRVA